MLFPENGESESDESGSCSSEEGECENPDEADVTDDQEQEAEIMETYL